MQSSEEKMKAYVTKIESYMSKYKYFERGDGESANEIWITQSIENLQNMSGKKARKIDAEGHIENYKQNLEIFNKIRDKIREGELDQDVLDQVKDQINEFVEEIQDKVEMQDLSVYDCIIDYLYDDDNDNDEYNQNYEEQSQSDQEIQNEEQKEEQNQQQITQQSQPQVQSQPVVQQIQQQPASKFTSQPQENKGFSSEPVKTQLSVQQQQQNYSNQQHTQLQFQIQKSDKVFQPKIVLQSQPQQQKQFVLQQQPQIQQQQTIQQPQQQQLQIPVKKEQQSHFTLQDKPSQNSYHFTSVANDEKPKAQTKFQLMSTPANQFKEIQKKCQIQQQQFQSYTDYFNQDLIKLNNDCPLIQLKSNQQIKLAQNLYHQTVHFPVQQNQNFFFDNEVVSNSDELNGKLKEIYEQKQPIQHMSINKKDVSVSNCQQLQLNIEYFKTQQVQTLLFIVYHVNDTTIVNAAIEALRLRNFYFDSSIMKFVLKQTNELYWYNYNTGLIMIKDE